MVRVGEHSGQRIDNFLVRELKDVPKSRIYRMIRRGEVRVNGGRIKPTYRLKAEDRVRIPPHFARESGSQPFVDPRHLDRLEGAILHEDERLLVLDKPAGLAVHGGSGISLGAIEALRLLRPAATLELVHRLDRDTSGCLLVAKRRSTLRALHEQLRLGRIVKHYRVIVHGHWPKERRTVSEPLEKFVAPNGERRVRVSPAGRASRTSFEVEAQAGIATLLLAELHTGRTHQIRVHTRHLGHSIIGDEKYSTDEELSVDRRLGINRLCLHAQSLTLTLDGQARSFESPVPGEFQAAWRALEAEPGTASSG